MNGKLQNCIALSETNLSVIEKSLDYAMKEGNFSDIHNLIEARERIIDIKKLVSRVGEVELCWR